MANEEYYLTPADYARAEEYGISKGNVYNRFYVLNWSKERAITTPIKRDKEKVRWRKIANQNGISTSSFYDRIRRIGWDYERAATTPIMTKEQIRQASRKSRLRVFTEEQLLEAEKNGIPKRTAYQRVKNYKWTPERAVTEPVRTQFRRKDYAGKGR